MMHDESRIPVPLGRGVVNQLRKDLLPGNGNLPTGVIPSDPFPDFQVPRGFHVGIPLRLDAGQDTMGQCKTLVFREKQCLGGDVFERLHNPRLLRIGNGGKPNGGGSNNTDEAAA